MGWLLWNEKLYRLWAGLSNKGHADLTTSLIIGERAGEACNEKNCLFIRKPVEE